MQSNNPADSSIKSHLQLSLGHELYTKYEELIPLLGLCEYRLRTYKSYGTFDLMFNTEETTPALSAYRICLYPFIWLKNFMTPQKKCRKIMLSATVLKNPRYTSLLDNIDSKYIIIKTNTLSDIKVYSPTQSISQYIRNIFSSQTKKLFSWKNITGNELKSAVEEWLEFILYLSLNNKRCVDEQYKTELLLNNLYCAYNTRLEKIIKELKKDNIGLYITINQYNLRDFLLISACRKLGIKTRQLEHHASRFMHNIQALNEIYRFCYVDEICCWSQSEADFHKDIYKYECFTERQAPLIYPVGNPEISYSEARAAITKYTIQKRITFMVSGLLNSTDKDAVNSQMTFRKDIFRELKRLSDEKNIRILVRYPPGIDTDFRQEEEKELIGMNFEISPSDRQSLLSDICGSCRIVGTISSVLGLSALMGKPVYQVAKENEKYYITDKNIFTISLDQILQIPPDPPAFSLNPDDFIDYRRLLSLSD